MNAFQRRHPSAVAGILFVPRVEVGRGRARSSGDGDDGGNRVGVQGKGGRGEGEPGVERERSGGGDGAKGVRMVIKGLGVSKKVIVPHVRREYLALLEVTINTTSEEQATPKADK